MARLTGEALAVFVAESCARHGVPAKVSDRGVIAVVATLLTEDAGGGPARRGTAGRTRPRDRSETPDEIGAGWVEGVGAGISRGDDDVVEHGGDDGRLAG